MPGPRATQSHRLWGATATTCLTLAAAVRSDATRRGRLSGVALAQRGANALRRHQGIEAKANYRNSPIASVLPVEMELGDDREETPEGATPVVCGSHALTTALDSQWPTLLGFQRVTARPGAAVLIRVKDYPLLVIAAAGLGRTLAYTTDIGPHWAPTGFTDWSGFGILWDRLVLYLAGGDV